MGIKFPLGRYTHEHSDMDETRSLGRYRWRGCDGDFGVDGRGQSERECQQRGPNQTGS